MNVSLEHLMFERHVTLVTDPMAFALGLLRGYSCATSFWDSCGNLEYQDLSS
jgi:hypothetical protein